MAWGWNRDRLSVMYRRKRPRRLIAWCRTATHSIQYPPERNRLECAQRSKRKFRNPAGTILGKGFLGLVILPGGP
jgi:hypothetical protein